MTVNYRPFVKRLSREAEFKKSRPRKGLIERRAKHPYRPLLRRV